MDPTKFPSNNKTAGSTKPQDQRIHHDVVVQGVVSGKAKTSFGQKLRDFFIAEDVRDVQGYVLHDVIAPTFKNMIALGLLTTIGMIFYGKQGANRIPGMGFNPWFNSSIWAPTRMGIPTAGGVNYGKISSGGGTMAQTAMQSTYVRPNMIGVPTYGDAELIRDTMVDMMKTYGRVFIGEYYDILGVTGNGPTDWSYGWTDLLGTTITQQADGLYYLQLPKAKPLTM